MFALKKSPIALEDTYAILKLANTDSLYTKSIELRLEALVDETYLIIEKKLNLPPLEDIILQKKMGKGNYKVSVSPILFRVEDQIE